MHTPHPPQIPQGYSTANIPQVEHSGNIVFSPYALQHTATFNHAGPLAPVHSGFTPLYTPISHQYYLPDTPMPLHKKQRVDDETLPSFISPPTDNIQSRIKALTAEIEQLQRTLDKLIKEREMLGYNKRSPRLSVVQKLNAMIKTIDDVAKWTLGEFLHHLFKLKNDDGTDIHRSPKHAAMTSQFLQGRTIYGPSDILDAWFRHPDGRISKESDASKLMYSTDTPFHKIGPVRAALSTFAVQLVRDRLVHEVETAVKSSSGLHVSFKSQSDIQVTEWADIGATTISKVADIIKRHQPVTWYLMTEIAGRKLRKRKGVVAERKFRPVDGVSPSILVMDQWRLDVHDHRYAPTRSPHSTSVGASTRDFSPLPEDCYTLHSLPLLIYSATTAALPACFLIRQYQRYCTTYPTRPQKRLSLMVVTLKSTAK